VLLIGVDPLKNKEVRVIGYRNKYGKGFITSRKGWGVQFTHYEEF